MKSLIGKRALITGASRGLGRAIALQLASDGADIAITYEKSSEKAAAVVAEIEALGRRAVAIQASTAVTEDISRSVKETLAALGGLDILVNNAAVARGGPLEEMAPEDIDIMLNVNVRGVVLTTQAALPHLNEGARIINIGSCLAQRVPMPGVSVYAMTKSALLAFTCGLARDLGPKGITVNLVHPGPTDSDMNPAEGEGAAAQRQYIALGHYGQAEDVAAAVAFLASPAARQITGTSLNVDGGINA
ncbi:3-oxoacyl-ACP reductase family protein [Erwinia sp. P6884]|uniref:3-oxoacyl-ACP reductase family protein n=1 Tax=Erwinia sp. P6884 TaxID=3141450 RepID=UPI003190012D